MANPMYGQNKADGMTAWLQNTGEIKAHGTLAGNLTLDATDMVSHVAHTCDPAAARNVTTPTAAQIVAAMEVHAGSNINVGDSFEFLFINLGTEGADESCTVVAGTGVTLVGNVEVENFDTASDAISTGSGCFIVRVTSSTNSAEAVTIIRKS